MNAPVQIDQREIDAALLHGAFSAPDEGPRVQSLMRFGYLSIGAFFAIFLIWSWAAPLNSAAVATGILQADGGGRRTVQHLEGGIIKKFLVTDGQQVSARQPLVQLDATQSSARNSAVQTTFYNLLAQDARLTAERLGLSRVTYPAELLAERGNPEVRTIIATSNSVFQARLQSMYEQAGILNQRLGQSNAEIGSTNAQLASLSDQASLLAVEEKNVATLVDEGLERMPRLLALQRQRAATTGQIGQMKGNLAKLSGTIGETNAQIVFLRGQRATEAAAQQREVQQSLAEAREKLKISGDINGRQQIVAPVAGTVTNLRLVTQGGVIGPGQPVLDIVPSNEKILVSARLKANDIDVVHEGLQAEVRLTPYKMRVLPMLKGTIKAVSPDATFDEPTQSLYYKVMIELDRKEIDNLKDVKLISGMPAEVFIDIGARSLLQYFMQPLLDSFQRAFREG